LTYVYPLFYSMQVNDALRKFKLDIQPILIDMGIDIVDISLKKVGGIFTFSLLVDKSGGITIGECTRLNKRLRRHIEDKEFVSGRFFVEVSSPGVDRSFKAASDFKRLEGKIVDIWLSEPLDGQSLISGKIEYADEDIVNILDINNRQYIISYASIDKAKLKI